MNNGLFGTSGIRGVINEKITPKLAIDLAKSLKKGFVNSGEFLIGRDTRLSGEMLESSLTAGLLSTGFEVKKIGIVPTPVLGFSVSQLNATGGIMITASHNPPEYNGLKIFDSEGMAISPDREKRIEEIYRKKEFISSPWNKIGKVREIKILKDYLTQISRKISVDKRYKVVIDCANGPASKTTPHLLERIGCETLTINSNLDGTFPGRRPEPTAENLKDLSKFVKATDADLGLAHDGDGDRIAAVDNRGRFINQDKLLALIGSYSVKRFGKGIVTTVDASRIVDEQITEAGGKIERTKVGDVSVAQEMNSKNLKFGGEPSGTWIIGDIHMCPDGTLAAARIIEMLNDKDKKISQLVDSMPSYSTLRAKIACPDEKKTEKMNSVKEKALSYFEEVEEMLTIDGIRLELRTGDWILIRPSGTEPYIRITAEAHNESRAKNLLNTGKQLLQED